MKKLFIALFVFSSATIYAQSGFGVKAGLNFADNGSIEYTDFTDTAENIMEEDASRKTGYHFGVFYRMDLLNLIYIKPELVYTQTISSYEYKGGDAELEMSKIDLPILVGVDILGPVHVFAGPSLQYVLENDFAGASLEDFKNEFTVGAQFGIGVQYNGIGLDVRYEQALTEKQAELTGLDNSNVRLDSRPNQFIVSLSLNL